MNDLSSDILNDSLNPYRVRNRKISVLPNSFRECLVTLALFALSNLYLHHGHHVPHLAYIGPGSGFAFISSFLTLVVGFFASVLSLLSWPFRILLRSVRRHKGFRDARVKKVIFLGLDGLDPRLTERFIAEGKMPNLAKLAADGSYSRLRTTYPALSPVAWSTFATGVNPAKHNIFDFLDRSLKSYLPQLSSARVNKPRRIFHIGRLRIPSSGATVELLRKSKPFWKTLGEHGIGSTVIRIPITFPPEKFDGNSLRFATKNGESITLGADEFIRRFLQHILPAGFVKIRHFGLNASRNVKTRLATARLLLDGGARHATTAPVTPAARLDYRALLLRLTGIDPDLCSRCGGRLDRRPLSLDTS